MDDDLERRLEQRAERGDAAGPDAVWLAARATASAPSSPRPLGLVAAAVVIVAGLVIGALVVNGGEERAPGVASRPGSVPSAPPVVVAQNASSLVLFDDCTAVLDELKAEALERVGPYGLDGRGLGWYYREGDLAANEQGNYVSSRLASLGAPDASATNTQEVGIDEPDLVETDGERLFDVHGGTLRVTDIDAAEVTATMPLGLVAVVGAVLVDDALVVFGNEPLDEVRRGEAKVVVVDVEGAPAVRQRLTIDGLLVDVRAVDGRVHVITSSAPTIAFTYTYEQDESAQDAATEANKERIRSSTLADWLPSRTVTDGDGTVTADRAQLTECREIRRPQEFSGFEQTSLVTLDLDDLAASHSTSVQASSLLVYGSDDSLYTATTGYQDPTASLGVARPIVGDDTHTDIHRFALGPEPDYAGSGRVEGFVETQFALSEHDGHLRVASSTVEGGGDNRVTVLRVAPGSLVEAGVVDGLGPSEQIEGVRFLGDLGYVVTFRRTDPLYVVDLHDPAAPRLAGKLEIPGYSQYLHPVSDDLVLGVGYDGTEEGLLGRAAMSLFDVSDPAAPDRVDLESFEATEPKLEGDHHAFTWSADTSTAYMPVGLLAAGHAVVVVRVDGSDLQRVGTVRAEGEGAPAKAAFDRIVLVGDRVLSVSPQGIQVSDADSLAPIAWVAYR